MEPSREAPLRRTLTPAVLAASLFTAACAVGAISFVAARGGLQLPLASGAGSAVAQATSPATPAVEPSVAPAVAPTASPATPTPMPPTPAPSIPPPIGSAPPPTPVPSLDPLAVLPPCPDHPGCYIYTIRRGDTLSTISDHWLISVWIIQALNPQITDPSTIVVGHALYLGRSPFLRLDRCPDTPGCYLYVVRPGDRLSIIAGRFATSTLAILELNPQISDANAIYSGQTIRLPGPI